MRVGPIRNIMILLYFAISLSICGCSLTQTKSTPNLVITADKTTMMGDNTDQITLTVLCKDREGNITYPDAADIFVNSMKMNGNSFKTSVEGVYTFTAQYNGLVSAPLKVSVGFSSNVPVVVVDAAGKITDSAEMTSATMKIINNKYGLRNTMNDEPELECNIKIRLRGQSSLEFPKKQYKVTILDNMGEEAEVSLLDLPKESDWVLNGSYADKSLIRNYLAYELGSQLMYTPRTRFVEVFIRESDEEKETVYDYKGVYLLIESIKRDKNRVDIEKLAPEDNTEPDISGGYIIARDKIKPGDKFFRTKRGDILTYVYPNKDTISDQQKAWIQNYVNSLEDALYGRNFTDPSEGYAKYIDIDSFIDCILIDEFLKSIDGFRISTYMYKKRNGKLAAGPLWDFDLSVGNVDYLDGSNPEGWYITKLNWNERLMQDPNFVKKLADRWKELRKGILNQENVERIIDYATQILSEAQIRNFKRWDEFNGEYIWPNPEPYTMNYAEEITRMKKFLVDRGTWIDLNIFEYRP